jgi:hypothetical protein
VQRPSVSVGELTSRYFEDNVRLWSQYSEGLRRLSEDTFLPLTSGQSRVPGTPAIGERARELVQLSVSHYANLLTTYADFAGRFTQAILQPSSSAGGSASTPAAAGTEAETGAPDTGRAPARIELTFSGLVGEIASESFAVVNRKAEDLDVTFELTEFVREDGHHRFRAPVIFVPDRFVLAPGHQQIVECRILLGEPFTTGARHVAMARVPGFPEVQLVLLVRPQSRPQQTAAAIVETPDRPAPASTRSVSRVAKRPPGRSPRKPR